MLDLQIAAEKIFKNRRYFEKVLDTASNLISQQKYESAAKYLNEIARFAWGNCTGYYTSWTLERLGIEIGRSTIDTSAADQIKHDKYYPKKGNFRILHVATSLHEVGGHTRLLLNWLKNDSEREQKVIITRQLERNLPFDLIEAHQLDKSVFKALNDESSIITKAVELRELGQNFDLVFLHIHPDDIIPLIAFSVENLPPVALVNHADHIFWIGSSVTDVLVQIRESNMQMDKQRRGIQNQAFLPIPFSKIPKTNSDEYKRSRDKLGIRSDSILMLTIGDEYKYQPIGENNFLKGIENVLNNYPNAFLLVIGVSADSPLAKLHFHKQIKFLGLIKDTSLYEKAADIYIEGFPLFLLLQCYK